MMSCPGLAPDEDTPHGSGGTDAQRRIAALDLVRRSVGEIGAVAFAGVDNEHTSFSRGSQNLAARLNRHLQPGDIVAESGPKPTRLQKVALHVDDDQRRPPEIDGKR